MPSSSRLTELCRYHYDPLDRQAGCTLSLLQPATLQRFYCKSRLATEVQGAVGTSLFQHDDQLLAQQQRQDGKVDATLLATDQQRSVLAALDTTRPHPLAYSPYGHRPTENGLLSLLGFNGEQPDPITGCYHLGNGYRQFNPVLMRFNNPDSWSPFGKGGLNAYAYVGGDPVGRSDPTGHVWNLLKLLPRPKSVLNFVKPTLRKASAVPLIVGTAGLVVEELVELDETSSSLLLYASFALIGAGATGALITTLRKRPLSLTRLNPASSSSRLPTNTGSRTTRAQNVPRSSPVNTDIPHDPSPPYPSDGGLRRSDDGLPSYDDVFPDRRNPDNIAMQTLTIRGQ